MTPRLTLDGRTPPADFDRALVAVVVDRQVDLPTMVEVHLRDTHHDLLQRLGIRFGSVIRVEAVGDPDASGHDHAGTATDPAVCGVATVAGMEQSADPTGTRVILRAYDPAHGLARGRRTRRFTDVTDGDIVRQVAAAAGLEIERIDDDGPVHEYRAQTNVSDWHFLQALAHETGHVVDCASGRLSWRRPTPPGSGPAGIPPGPDDPPATAELRWGREITRFRPRVTLAEQVAEVEVRGWDPDRKQSVAAAGRPGGSAQIGVAPEALAATAGPGKHTVVDRAVSSQSDADVLAAACALGVGATHAQTHATVVGDPLLLPGLAVRVSGVGWPHDGRYVVTGARHVWDDSGYRTELVASGGRSRSVAGLVASPPDTWRTGGMPVPGLAVGQVTDVADPAGQFRVKVTLPWLAADHESWWCRVAAPGAGNGRGVAWLPEVGDEVLVGFAFGDAQVPFVVGGLFNGVDAPPGATDLVDPTSATVASRQLASRAGHRLVFSDGADTSQALLATGDDAARITLDASGVRIDIDTDGTVTVHGARGVSVQSDADLTVAAGGTLHLSGADGVTVDGGPRVAVTGDVIELN